MAKSEASVCSLKGLLRSGRERERENEFLGDGLLQRFKGILEFFGPYPSSSFLQQVIERGGYCGIAFDEPLVVVHQTKEGP